METTKKIKLYQRICKKILGAQYARAKQANALRKDGKIKKAFLKKHACQPFLTNVEIENFVRAQNLLANIKLSSLATMIFDFEKKQMEDKNAIN